MSVAPGATNTYVLKISGGQSLFGGLDVSATAGALAAFESGTKLLNGEVTHTGPKAVSSGAVSFSFRWTAPSTPGTASLYGAGLSSNGSGTGGDEVSLMSLSISVQSAPQPNQAPVADPGGPYSGASGTAIAMDGSKSFDSDGRIASFSWDYGDGSALGSGSRPSHAYASAGTFTITLTVTDDQGSTGKKQTVATISAPGNQPPVASSGGPYNVALGSPVQFNGSASKDPDGTIASFSWSYGDGSRPGTGDRPAYTYSAAGTFTVTLTVTDNIGLMDTDQTVVQVNDGSVPLPGPGPDPGSSNITCRLLAPDTMTVPGTGSVNANVVVDAYVGGLPPGTTGCGTAYLFKNGVQVDQQPVCIELSTPAVGGDDEADDDARATARAQKILRVKTATGVQLQSRATATLSASNQLIRFTPSVSWSDNPTVLWSAYVEIGSYKSDTVEKSTQLTLRRRR
jgi:PKD repeat protein